MSIYDNSGWYVLVRAHDHIWADRTLPLAHRIEVCAFLHKQSLIVDPAEYAITGDQQLMDGPRWNPFAKGCTR